MEKGPYFVTLCDDVLSWDRRCSRAMWGTVGPTRRGQKTTVRPTRSTFLASQSAIRMRPEQHAHVYMYLHGILTSIYVPLCLCAVGGLVDKSAFDVLGKQGARPFEVATVRLANMIDIIPNWERLAPPDKVRSTILRVD